MNVTAVIPVHNHVHWVADAIRSVASQDYRPLRMVVIDDGSKDGSAGAVLDLMDLPHDLQRPGESWSAVGTVSGTDIRLLLQSFPVAGGPSRARNQGMKAGWEGTDVFALLDSDDLYLPGKISLSVEKFTRSPETAVVYSDYETFRPDGLRLRQFKEPYSRRRLLSECIVNCDSLVSRPAVEKVGFFDEELRVCEDYDWWLRLSEHFILSHIPECLVSIRVGEHSSTSQVQKAVWEAAWTRVRQKALERARAG